MDREVSGANKCVKLFLSYYVSDSIEAWTEKFLGQINVSRYFSVIMCQIPLKLGQRKKARANKCVKIFLSYYVSDSIEAWTEKFLGQINVSSYFSVIMCQIPLKLGQRSF